MRYKRKILAAFLAIFAVLLAYKQLVIAKEWDFQPVYDVNKVWEVRFSMPLDSSSLTENSIYVLDNKDKHAITFRLIDNGYTLRVSPSRPYEVGKQYRLMVTSAVKSTDGQPLKEPAELPFEVVNMTDAIQAFYSQSNGAFTNITVMTSPDVFRITVGGQEMDYKGNNRYKATLIDAKPGSTVSVISYDESNKRLQTKSFKLE